MRVIASIVVFYYYLLLSSLRGTKQSLLRCHLARVVGEHASEVVICSSLVAVFHTVLLLLSNLLHLEVFVSIVPTAITARVSIGEQVRSRCSGIGLAAKWIQEESAFKLLHGLKSTIADALSCQARQKSGSAPTRRI